MNTTFSSCPKQIDFNIDDMLKAMPLLPELNKKLQMIRLNKKDWKQLQKNLNIQEPKKNIGSLCGIKIIVKPYIKKAQLIYYPDKLPMY